MEESLQSSPQHLLDLIRVVKPRAALFATYTFSIGYFDAVFLPALRAVGCKDIAVLVDADEAVLSASEFSSRAAGRVYRMLPVKAPGGGVFHPKISYLIADSDDVLSVGSGNLTASGQSLQLESFDAVAAKQAPEVFEQLASWMSRLAKLVHDSSMQASSVLSGMSTRVVKAAQLGRLSQANLPAGSVRLISNLSQLASSQMLDMFAERHESANQLVVLSPFHSADGKPVLRLATAVGAQKLCVGLNGGGRALMAPFDQEKFKAPVSGGFVLPEHARAKSRLHAKVFEFQTAAGCLLVTGSVNATAQSLETSKNVELSLARWLDESPFKWRDIEVEGYESTHDPSTFHAQAHLYLEAWLNEDHELEGRVSARAPFTKTARLSVRNMTQSLVELDLDLDEQGSFAAPMPADLDTSQTLQACVTCGELEATCWLNLHEELKATNESREQRAAAQRVLSGSYDSQDVAELISLFTTVIDPKASLTPSPKPRLKSQSTNAEPSPAFVFSDWERSGKAHGPRTSYLGRNAYHLLKALSVWLNAQGTAVEQKPQTEPALGDPSTSRSNGAPGSTSAAPVNPLVLLDHLCLAMPAALNRGVGLEHSALLVEVAAARAVHRSVSEDLGVASCQSWLERFANVGYPESARRALAPVAVAVACVVAQGLFARQKDPNLPMLREAVERMVGRPLGAEWEELALQGLSRDLFKRVPDRPRVAAWAAAIAAALTVEDNLMSLLHKAFNGGRATLTSQPEAALFPDVANKLKECRRTRQVLLQGLHKNIDAAPKACPHCGQALSADEQAEVLRRRAVVHKNLMCKEVVIYSPEPDVLAARLQELPDA